MENEMKFAIVKTDLIKPLSHINSVVERKNAIAILSNLVIEAVGKEINLSLIHISEPTRRM